MNNYEEFIKQIKKKIKINSNHYYNSSNYKYHIKILNIIKLAYQEYNNTKFNITTSNTLPIGKYHNDIPITIRKHIVKTNLYVTNHKFNIDKRVFNVNIITYNNKFNDNNKLKTLYITLFLFNYLSNNSTCSNHLNIYIYCTSFIKKLPDSFKILDSENINSGFTRTCMSHNDIYIFRNEEWNKVLIHECMHAFGFDFSHSKENDIYSSKIIQKIFPVNFDLALYEAYCETYTIYINLIIKAFLTTYSKNSPDFDKKVLDKTFNMFNNEIYFSLFQSSKILHYYDINYNMLHTKNKTVIYKYDEYTPVFSYFIIKTILIYHFNDFFKWCYTNNEFIIPFNCNEKKSCLKKIKSFCNIISSVYKNPSFINDFNNIYYVFSLTKSNNIMYNNLKFALYS
jgi:hypothetical protein